MNVMFIPAVVIAVIVIFGLGVVLNEILNPIQRKQLKKLDNAIYGKALELERLENAIQATSMELNEIHTQALDVFDRSNIRIPKDIIEDMAQHRFTSVEMCIDYIENQRAHWKLENGKKVFK